MLLKGVKGRAVCFLINPIDHDRKLKLLLNSVTKTSKYMHISCLTEYTLTLIFYTSRTCFFIFVKLLKL